MTHIKLTRYVCNIHRVICSLNCLQNGFVVVQTSISCTRTIVRNVEDELSYTPYTAYERRRAKASNKMPWKPEISDSHLLGGIFIILYNIISSRYTCIYCCTTSCWQQFNLCFIKFGICMVKSMWANTSRICYTATRYWYMMPTQYITRVLP